MQRRQGFLIGRNMLTERSEKENERLRTFSSSAVGGGLAYLPHSRSYEILTEKNIKNELRSTLKTPGYLRDTIKNRDEF
jgi:3-methyladenine DNA glycosylase AlkC